MEHFGPFLTLSANFGLDRLTEAGAAENQFHVAFGYFLFLFSGLQTQPLNRS
jgi:hypothetical protein